MKKVINGKLYDTEKAKLLGDYDNGLSVTDFRWCREELYLKRTGEYFLFGEGGPMSKYCELLPDRCRTSGELITPLSYEEAQMWVEEHLDADDYEKIFGVIDEEDTSKDILRVYILRSNISKLKTGAAKQGINTSQYLDKILSDFNSGE